MEQDNSTDAKQRLVIDATCHTCNFNLVDYDVPIARGNIPTGDQPQDRRYEGDIPTILKPFEGCC